MSLATWKDLCLDATDQRALGDFWAAVIGLQVETSPGKLSLEGEHDYQRVWVNAVDRVSTGLDQRKQNRLHLDVYAAAIADLETLGATVLAPAEETGLEWTVMADPEGGEFCAFVRDAAVPPGLPAYRLHGIGIDCADPAAQAAWWGGVLGREVTTYDGDDDLVTLEHATPDPVLTLDFARVPEPRVGPNRVHWDLTGDLEPILDAGATRLWETEHWTTLADPEGNEFCVFPPSQSSSRR